MPRGANITWPSSTEGWWCTDSASFFENRRATLALQALEATSLLSLSLTDLEQLCTQMPTFERFFRLLSQKGYQLLERRLVAMLRLTAEARFMRFHQQYPRAKAYCVLPGDHAQVFEHVAPQTHAVGAFLK
jgi:hypothetical protein